MTNVDALIAKTDLVWRPVYGWDKFYEVSNTGLIKNLKTKKILETRSKEKYPRVGLGVHGKWSLRSVHSLVLEAFVSPRPFGMVANHKDGNKHNNNLENLEWVTPSQNTQHGFDVLHRNTPRGENHGMAKLNNSIVKQIRKLHKTGKYSQWKLAHLFNIGRSSIQRVVSWKTWRENV